jgi:hypothetical protein
MSQQPIEKDNLPTQSNNTTKLLDTAEKIVDKFTKSETVELTEVAAKTTENIFTVLVTSGGKPVAVILSIAILIVATAIPIVAVKLSPSQINPPTNNSHLTR